MSDFQPGERVKVEYETTIDTILQRRDLAYVKPAAGGLAAVVPLSALTSLDRPRVSDTSWTCVLCGKEIEPETDEQGTTIRSAVYVGPGRDWDKNSAHFECWRTRKAS